MRRFGVSGTPLALAAILIVGEIALYALWPHIDDNDAPPTLEQQLGVAAPVLLLVLPHILARLGYRGRPRLLTVAGVLGVVLTGLSVVGYSLIFITIPFLLIPSIVYLVQGSFRAPRSIETGVLVASAAALALAAAAVLFLTQDPRCTLLVRRAGELHYEEPATCTPGNSGVLGADVVEWSATSDTIALHESLLSLALSGAVLMVSVRATPKEDATARPCAVEDLVRPRS